MSWTPRVHLDRGDGSPLCGRRGQGAPLLAGDDGQPACKSCAALADGTYNAGNRWADVRPCGSRAACRRHRRRGEPVDRACLDADNRHNADRRAARKKAAS